MNGCLYVAFDYIIALGIFYVDETTEQHLIWWFTDFCKWSGENEIMKIIVLFNMRITKMCFFALQWENVKFMWP